MTPTSFIAPEPPTMAQAYIAKAQEFIAKLQLALTMPSLKRAIQKELPLYLKCAPPPPPLPHGKKGKTHRSTLVAPGRGVGATHGRRSGGGQRRGEGATLQPRWGRHADPPAPTKGRGAGPPPGGQADFFRGPAARAAMPPLPSFLQCRPPRPPSRPPAPPKGRGVRLSRLLAGSRCTNPPRKPPPVPSSRAVPPAPHPSLLSASRPRRCRR